MEFINRETEIKYLNGLWAENKAHLVIVYGKRRVGKTAIIKEFLKNKKSIYFLADKITEQENIKLLSQKIGDYFNDSFLKERGFNSWLQIFEYLKKKNDDSRLYLPC